MNQGDAIPEMKVTPDAGLTKRYAAASGDPNPIHTDEEFARNVGLPGCILHGLYSMAQVARANTAAAGGDPRKLKRLSVQFRGMGFPEQEITVTGNGQGGARRPSSSSTRSPSRAATRSSATRKLKSRSEPHSPQLVAWS